MLHVQDEAAVLSLLPGRASPASAVLPAAQPQPLLLPAWRESLRDSPAAQPAPGHGDTAHSCLAASLWPMARVPSSHPPKAGLCRVGLGLSCGIVSKASESPGHIRACKCPRLGAAPCHLQCVQLFQWLQKGCWGWPFVAQAPCVRELGDAGQ